MSVDHIIIGTAGHVDHGKTLLTAALTGVSTDRLPEEKRRGMTIVPGFVPLDLRSGRRLGFIDVPGHERFVKNMLAGVAGIDVALLVVAADEGVMPQTVEHLNILHLLGICHGVVAITKCDMVEQDWLELIHEQVGELLAKTSLANAQLIDVSAVSGYNIEALRDMLDEVSSHVKKRPSSGLCRLPIDRVFTKQGFGTVVTGTLWSGKVHNGDRLELVPSGEELRVRGIQVHGETVDTAYAGQRTAINLAGQGVKSAAPGYFLAKPGLLRESHRLDVELELLVQPIKRQARVRVFHGTAEALGRVRLLDREALEPGGKCLCQLELESPLPPLRGDRLIIRSYSPSVTIAGATVLDASPVRYKISSPGVMDIITRKSGLDSGEAVASILERRAEMLTQAAISRAAQLTPEDTAGALKDLLVAGRVGEMTVDSELQYYAASYIREWTSSLLAQLDAYHAGHPLRRGMPIAEVHQRVFDKLGTRQLSGMLENLAAQGFVAIDGAYVAKAGFKCTLTDRQKADIDAIESAYMDGLFTPPEWEEITKAIPAPHADEYLSWLMENGRLTQAGGVLFSTSAVLKAEETLRARFKEFTLAEARDALASSRKYVLALLEHFDSRRITKRDGEKRRFIRLT